MYLLQKGGILIINLVLSLAQVSRPVPNRYLLQTIKLHQKQSSLNFLARVKNLDKKEQFKIHFLYLQTDN